MDKTIECAMTIDEGNQKINIAGLLDEDFEIDFSSDIDFTDLVSKLTEKIDTLQKINITLEEESDDEKINLIANTIKEIFDLYNQNIVDQEASEEVAGMSTSDEIPFWTRMTINDQYHRSKLPSNR